MTNFTHVRRPEISGSRLCPAEPRLELVRVEHTNDLLGCGFSSKDDFLLRFLVNEDLEAFVDEALAPAHARVVTDEKVVHQVRLAEVAKSNDVLPRNLAQRHPIQIYDRDPLLDLAGDKHNIFNVCEHERERVIEHLLSHDLWLFLDQSSHDSPIHHDARPVPLVATKNVEEARLKQPDCQAGQTWLRWSRSEPLEVLS